MQVQTFQRKKRTSGVEENKVSKDYPVRIDSDMIKIIRMIQAKYLLQGKTPPSTRSITKIMAKEIDEDNILKKVFIKF